MTKEFLSESWVFLLAGFLFLGALTGGCIWYAAEFGVEVQVARSSTSFSNAQLREVSLEELQQMYTTAGSTVTIDAFGIPSIDHFEMSRIASAMADVRTKEAASGG